MDASGAPPQETKKATKNSYIPPEIVEEILLNLRVKPLLRFSSVSKSWNSMIFGSKFVKKHRVRAAVLGWERIILTHHLSSRHPSSFPLSAVSPDNPTVGPAAPALVFPFRYTTTIKAFCDELWCLRDLINELVFLWNPSMRKYYVLPKPNFVDDGCNQWRLNECIYGLGYDSVNDDYKVMKVGLDYDYKPCVAQLYSLRSNSWREIMHFCGDDTLRSGTMSVFVGGAINWLFSDSFRRVIISFDLSTEKYGELALPEMDNFSERAEITVLRGKLCLFMKYSKGRDAKFAFWMMEDYGFVESWWTRVFDIDCTTIPCFKRHYSILIPFYFFDDGRFLVSVFVDQKFFLGYLVPGGEKEDDNWVFLSKDEETKLSNYFNCGIDSISRSFVYFESLVSPSPARDLASSI